MTIEPKMGLKEKVNLSLCLINQALCYEDIWGNGGTAPPFLTLALYGGKQPKMGANTKYNQQQTILFSHIQALKDHLK
jgi:hypothetical protein